MKVGFKGGYISQTCYPGVFSEDIEYVCYGTVIQEVKTSNVAREVRGFIDFVYKIVTMIIHVFLSLICCSFCNVGTTLMSIVWTKLKFAAKF